MNEETFDINRAADFLCIHANTMQELAASGAIPHAAKIGRAWVFLKSGLIEYIKDQAAKQNKLRRAGKIGREEAAANDTTGPQETRRRGGSRRTPPPLPELPKHIRKEA